MAAVQNASLPADQNLDRFWLVCDAPCLQVGQVSGVGKDCWFLSIVLGQLIEKNNIEQRLMHLNTAVVTD